MEDHWSAMYKKVAVACHLFSDMTVAQETLGTYKSEVFQCPEMNTGKPVIKAMTLAPMKPHHAVNGWNIDFQGSVDLSTPWALSAA